MRETIEKENGVLALYAATDKDQPNQWYFFEIYANDAAYQAYRKTAHFQKYLQETADLLQDKTFIEITPALLMNQGGLQYSTP
jgi:antibiotic biosynthesis monooxygenase